MTESPNTIAGAAAIITTVLHEDTRRGIAYACLAELLRCGATDAAAELAGVLAASLPHDPDTARIPPNPPPILSADTHFKLDSEVAGPLLPFGKTPAEARADAMPERIVGMAEWLRDDNPAEAWPWIVAAVQAVDDWNKQGKTERTEPAGTVLAWLASGKTRVVSTWTIPEVLKDAWPNRDPEARHRGPNGDRMDRSMAVANAQLRQRLDRLAQGGVAES